MIFILIAILLAPGFVPRMPGAQVITLQVTAEQANIRERPDIMSAVLKQVVTGAILEAQKKEAEWYEVRVDLDAGGTVIGYVHESLVRVVAGAPAEARPAPKVVKEPPPEEVRPRPAEPEEKPKTPPAEPAPRRPEPSTTAPESRTAWEPAAGRASVSLWYGGRYAVVGDLNDGAEGMADYFASQLGVKKSSDVGSVHFGRSFGAEYRRPLVGGLAAAVGAGYFSAERSSTLGYEGRPTTTRFLTTPSVRAIPVSLSLLFYPVPGIYVKAGAELAFAHCEYLYRFEDGAASREWEGKANAIGLGYELAGGLERVVAGRVSVFAEAGYRKLRVGGLEGEEIYRESGKTDVATEGNLYFSRSAVPGGSTVAEVLIQPAIPGGTGVVEARKAELSLSGLSLRIGLKIEF
ncbi:MAG: hypothetical protein A2W03_14500 [Candidatus Aminicenantes bacterium RBG_16_63_16]|nr:MAG: hypothetical protein A2W03_14500 [Candidatus Aminicenantes bacterium RBG_16_63_16]